MNSNDPELHVVNFSRTSEKKIISALGGFPTKLFIIRALNMLLEAFIEDQLLKPPPIFRAGHAPFLGLRRVLLHQYLEPLRHTTFKQY